MKTNVLSAMAAIALATCPVVATAKGVIAKIVVRNESSSTPLEITDPTILGRFDIWYGPGVRVNNEPIHLNPDDPGPAFIDWLRAESAERSAGLARYEVTFVIDGRVRGTYVVLYEFDPAVAGGYIYLPGRGDPHASDNVRLIYHGVEGSWFHSSASWETLVRPLVVAAWTRP